MSTANRATAARWTKNQVIYAVPAFLPTRVPVAPRDEGVTNAGTESASTPSITRGTGPFRLDFLENVQTFDVTTLGSVDWGSHNTATLGAPGFNVPSVLGLRYHAPYFHNGSARNLDRSLQHRLAGWERLPT
jgi:hypothetical protein